MDTVDVDLSSLVSTVLDESQSVIENASDVFTNMVLKVVSLVLDTISLMVILTEVSHTVDNVSDSDAFESPSISSD